VKIAESRQADEISSLSLSKRAPIDCCLRQRPPTFLGSTMSSPVEDDRDSLYVHEDGETACPAPRRRRSRGEHEYCSDAEHLDEALDRQDVEADRAGAERSEREKKKDDGEVVGRGEEVCEAEELDDDNKSDEPGLKQLANGAGSMSTLDGLEEIQVLSDPDDLGSGAETGPNLLRPEFSHEASKLDDDDSGFASDENVIDDVEDIESDSSDKDESPAPRPQRGAMTTMGIAHQGKIESIVHGGNDTAFATQSPGIGASRRQAGAGTAILSSSRSSSAIGKSGQPLPGHTAGTHATATNGRDGKAAPLGGNFFHSIARAGATFYKAAFKPPRASNESGEVSEKTGSSTRRTGGPRPEDVNGTTNGSSPLPIYSSVAARKALEVQAVHHRLISMIDAQIATLNGAKAGFVDLSLSKPMTERTRKVIEEQAFAILCDFEKLETQIGDLEKEIAIIDRKTEEEICEKEQVLISAKLNMAEAQGDVINLKHDLAGVRKQLQNPDRIATKVHAQLRARASSARANAVVAMDARRAAEEKLESRRRQLDAERTTAKRLEAGCKDMEGDWA
jgi:hypothetical protein